MSDLHAAVEGYLAGLGDEDWLALVARVRPPDENDSHPKLTTAERALQFAEDLIAGHAELVGK